MLSHEKIIKAAGGDVSENMVNCFGVKVIAQTTVDSFTPATRIETISS